MIIERPPSIYRLLFPGAVWRIRSQQPAVYLTFDDGPVPEATPWVLDVLDDFGAQAAFFMVGDNAQRHPELLSMVRSRGHLVGNHTMHHTQGIRVGRQPYLADIADADSLLRSRLFRPPHGLMGWGQLQAVKQAGYTVVMNDVVTRDYDPSLTPARVARNAIEYARPGSVIVFHDSQKAWPNLRGALEDALHGLKRRGLALGRWPEELCVLSHISD